MKCLCQNDFFFVTFQKFGCFRRNVCWFCNGHGRRVRSCDLVYAASERPMKKSKFKDLTEFKLL